MKITLFSALTASALMLATPAAFAGDAHHQHHEHGVAGAESLHLDPAGRQWATDEVLRQSMERINRAMKQALPKIHRDRLGAAEYRKLAADIEQQVGEIVENCALTPEADAMLHRVVGELAGGADLMEDARPAARHEGADRVVHALKSYGRYFRHPGWKAAGG